MNVETKGLNCSVFAEHTTTSTGSTDHCWPTGLEPQIFTCVMLHKNKKYTKENSKLWGFLDLPFSQTEQMSTVADKSLIFVT